METDVCLQKRIRAVDSYLDCRRLGVGGANSVTTIVLQNGVDDVYRGLRVLVQRDIDALSGKAENVAIFDVQALTGQEPDAVKAGANSVDPEIANDHYVVAAGLNDDSICATDED